MKRRMIFCFVGILCVFLLAFHLSAGALSGTEVFRDNGGGVVRLFARVSGTPVAVISSGGTYFAATGGAVQVSGSSCDRAVHNNGTITLLFGSGNSTRVALASAGGIYAEFIVPQPVGAMRGYAMAGNAFWCCVGSELQVYDTAGTLQKSYALPATANSVAVTSGGRVLVFCNDGTTFAADGLPEELAAISSRGVNPLVPLGNDWFVDAYGHICYYSGGSIYGTGIVGTPPRFADYASCGISDVAAYAESGSSVAYCSLSTGEKLGSIPLDGDIKALAGGAVLLCSGNVYSIVCPEYAAATPTPVPTVSTVPTETPDAAVSPSPSVSPSHSPSSGKGHPLPDGVYLLETTAVIPVGTTAAQLRSADEVEDVLTAEGDRAAGDCRTGIRLVLRDGRDLFVVVPGDANGSGTVNTADITVLQKHVLGEELLSGVYLAAADLDGNGVLNTADLVRLADRLHK